MVMTRLKSSGSVSSEEPVELDNSVFLPARNRTRIEVEVTRNFNWPTGLPGTQIGPVNQEKFRGLVAQEVANLSGFVLFDQAEHFCVSLWVLRPESILFERGSLRSRSRPFRHG